VSLAPPVALTCHTAVTPCPRCHQEMTERTQNPGEGQSQLGRSPPTLHRMALPPWVAYLRQRGQRVTRRRRREDSAARRVLRDSKPDFVYPWGDLGLKIILPMNDVGWSESAWVRCDRHATDTWPRSEPSVGGDPMVAGISCTRGARSQRISRIERLSTHSLADRRLARFSHRWSETVSGEVRLRSFATDEQVAGRHLRRAAGGTAGSIRWNHLP
jgi:hypothetical protein